MRLYMRSRSAASVVIIVCWCSSPNSGLLKRSQFQTPICSGVNQAVAKEGSGCIEKRCRISWTFFH